MTLDAAELAGLRQVVDFEVDRAAAALGEVAARRTALVEARRACLDFAGDPAPDCLADMQAAAADQRARIARAAVIAEQIDALTDEFESRRAALALAIARQSAVGALADEARAAIRRKRNGA